MIEQEEILFLQDSDPTLFAYIQGALNYLENDPNTSIIKVRQFAELLAKRIALEENLSHEKDSNLLEILLQLQKTNVITSSQADIFHGLRKIGNLAAHPSPDEQLRDHQIARETVRKAIELIIWFGRTYRNQMPVDHKNLSGNRIKQSSQQEKHLVPYDRQQDRGTYSSTNRLCVTNGKETGSRSRTRYHDGHDLVQLFIKWTGFSLGTTTLASYFSISKEIDSLIEHFRNIERTRDDLIRVVVVGEFRSGKSTLVNFLLRRNLSPTDILDETTASIIHFIPTTVAEYCEIKYPDGSSSRVDGSELIQNYKRMPHGDEEIFFHINNEMNLILVDTPGMGGSIVNEKKVINNLLIADVILWLIDCTMIGSAREYGLIKYLKENKIPLVLGLTFWDLVDHNEKMKVVSYCSKTYEISKDDIFLLDNSSDQECPGLTLLRGHLDQNIAIRNAEIRSKAINSRVQILAKEIERIVSDLVKKLSDMQQQYDRLNTIINDISGSIADDSKYFVKTFVAENFLNDQNIKHTFSDVSALKSIDGGITVPSWYMTQFLSKLREEYQNFSKRQWLRVVGPIVENIDCRQLSVNHPQIYIERRETKVLDRQKSTQTTELDPDSLVKAIALGVVGWIAGGPLAAFSVGAISYVLNAKHSSDRDSTPEIEVEEILCRLREEFQQQVDVELIPLIDSTNQEIKNRMLERLQQQKFGLCKLDDINLCLEEASALVETTGKLIN